MAVTRGRIAAALLALLPLVAVAGHGVPDTPTALLDQYFRSQYLSALGRVLVVRDESRPAYVGDPQERLLGGYYASYQLARYADYYYTSREQRRPGAETLDQAAFALGKRYLRRGLNAEARRMLESVRGTLGPAQEGERRVLLAVALDHLGERERAVELVDGLPAGHLDLYGRFNAAVINLRLGRDGPGVLHLQALAALPAVTTDLRALRDRALLLLGLWHLQRGEYGDARDYLRHVRLRGPHANEALLALGWVEYSAQQLVPALRAWLELAQRDPREPAVLEALWAVPYAFEQGRSHGQAMDRYLKAIAVYRGAILSYDTAIAATQSGSFLTTMAARGLAQGMPESDAWIVPHLYPEDRIEMRYLGELLASDGFNEAFREWRALAYLETMLEQWPRASATLGELAGRDPAEMTAGIAAQQAFLEGRERDGVSSETFAWTFRLANGQADQDLIRRLGELARLDSRLDRLVGEPGNGADRHRLIRGLLRWKTGKDIGDYPGEGEAQLESYRDAVAELATLEAGAWRDAATIAAPQVAEWRAQLKQLDVRAAELLPRAREARRRMGQHLQNAATRELVRQRQLVESYLLHTAAAVARVRVFAPSPEELAAQVESTKDAAQATPPPGGAQ